MGTYATRLKQSGLVCAGAQKFLVFKWVALDLAMVAQGKKRCASLLKTPAQKIRFFDLLGTFSVTNCVSVDN
jgi:hypothetical protein